MSPKDQLIYLHGLVASLPASQQLLVNAAKAELTDIIKKHGQMGLIALTVISAEIVAED